MRWRLLQAPFSNQLGSEDRDQHWREIVAGLQKTNQQAAFAPASEIYRAALVLGLQKERL